MAKAGSEPAGMPYHWLKRPVLVGIVEGWPRWRQVNSLLQDNKG
jgi:hypothetical protein